MHQPSSPRILLAPTSPLVFKKEELMVAPNLVATVRGADTERRGEGVFVSSDWQQWHRGGKGSGGEEDGASGDRVRGSPAEACGRGL